jgi:hypothetical protein
MIGDLAFERVTKLGNPRALQRAVARANDFTLNIGALDLGSELAPVGAASPASPETLNIVLTRGCNPRGTPTFAASIELGADCPTA